MKDNSTIQKFISTLLIIAMLIPALSIFSIPKKANAQWYDFITEAFTGVSAGATTTSAASGTVTATAATTSATANTTSAAQTTILTTTTLKNWAKTILQETLMMVAKAFLAKLTQATINWINSDFHGSPLFVENPGSFFGDIAKSEIKTLVDLYGLDPNRFPFGKDFALNIIASYKRQLADNTQYTLSNVIKDATLLNNYRNDFNVGGWNGFLINTQYPQNNYLGFNMLASEELARKLQGTVQNAAQKVQTTLQQGMGFLSPQTCQTNPNYNNMINEFAKPSFTFNETAWAKANPLPPADDLDANEAHDQKYTDDKAAAQAAFNSPTGSNVCPPHADGSSGLVSTTPGSVAANQIMMAMGSSFRQSELGAALGNSLSAIFDALIGHFLDKGLSALSSTISPTSSVDNWSYNGQTLNGSTTLGETGALNIPSNVSVTVGQTTSTPIYGGTGPFWIRTSPIATIATAKIDTSSSSGPTLTVTGHAPGQTSFVITDSSNPTLQTANVQITVNAVGALAVIPANILTGLSNPFIATISGGTGPYSIVTGPDESVAIASFSDSSIVVTGISSGTTLVTFADSSTPIKTVTVPIVIQGPQDLAVTPNNISISVGSTTSATISGGKTPYFVQNVLYPTVATAQISSATPTVLTITGMSSGTTPVIVTDSSTPAKTVIVNVVAGILGTCKNTSGGIISSNITQPQCPSVIGQWTQNQ